MRMLKLKDEYIDTGFRIVPISMYTINYLEKNLGDFFLHMKDGQIHAIININEVYSKYKHDKEIDECYKKILR